MKLKYPKMEKLMNSVDLVQKQSYQNSQGRRNIKMKPLSLAVGCFLLQTSLKKTAVHSGGGIYRQL